MVDAPKPFPPGRPLRITPTDVAQFVRLGQCQRFLRLRLHERQGGRGFLTEAKVAAQEPPPMMMLGGTDFETDVVADLRAVLPTRDCAAASSNRHDDHAVIAEHARALPEGAAVVLLQPRLRGQFGQWHLRGDGDLLRLDRGADGSLTLLIADIKSSETSKVEHRLQIAFYREMLAQLLGNEQIACEEIGLAVLYRGDPEEAGQASELRRDAETTFATSRGYLERVADPDAYADAVRDLVMGDASVARRIAEADFDDLPFHLTYRCDWCSYNPWCMKWAAERDDLSLVPFLSETDKAALIRQGVTSATALSTVKADGPDGELVVPAAGATLAATLATTWPIGPRLDELVLRARRYRRWKGDPVSAPAFLPDRGYGSLPYCAPDHNPNLVWIYVDTQHDTRHDRLWLAGSLVVAAENGEIDPQRRRTVVRMADGPPESADAERELLIEWIDATLRAVLELAAPDADGERRAPIHLVFFNRFDQEIFLDALARHEDDVLSATPLYDFVTQLAAFDSPVATFLVDEVRELRNYPMLMQSLQSLATFRGFDWNSPRPFRRLFRERLFDYAARLPTDEGERDGEWYASRSRFNSQIPLEFAYAAWGRLPEAIPGKDDDFRPYRGVARDDLVAFQGRRLEAMAHIAADFTGNQKTQKTPFSLPNLDEFADRGSTLAHALDEFVTIERHAELAAWKAARRPLPERRVLAGDSLLVRYDEVDQTPDVAAANRENRRRRELREEQRRRYTELHPDAKQVRLPKEEKAKSDWSMDGMRVRLAVETAGIDCGLQQLLDLNRFQSGDVVIVAPRTDIDSRFPDEQRQYTPTPKSLLRGMRAELEGFHVVRDDDGRADSAFVDLKITERSGASKPAGFVFHGNSRPFLDGEVLTIDSDPNSWTGYWSKRITEGLVSGHDQALYRRLVDPTGARRNWPEAAAEGQRRFMAGLAELGALGAMHAFEPSKTRYIGELGETPILLVQGPPGTGKSFTTAFALFARLQGAMAAGIDLRVLVSCHTHAAIDVLMANLERTRQDLETISRRHADVFRRYFDDRLLEVPLFRYRGKERATGDIVDLKRMRDGAETAAADIVAAHPWAVLGATPGAVYGLIDERWKGEYFDHRLFDCAVLDEASQIGLPMAVMATLPLKEVGALIVVGDHRQMPPIIKHDWMNERRRTFREFKAYDSLFLTLLGLSPRPPLVQFEESFRLHADMASFLGREIYRQDGIDFHSRKRHALRHVEHGEPFVDAVLDPAHSLVVVVHDERDSQVSNAFERALVGEIGRHLGDPRLYDDDADDGFGIVVPHRAQRAAFAPMLSRWPERVGRRAVIADTVERFQGDEREVILISATESDPTYLIEQSGFLLEPRRLTVALSRAKRKLVLIASRSVFELFSPEETAFANAQLWKNLLQRTCTVRLWQGNREGHLVEVWGNAESADRPAGVGGSGEGY